MNVDVHRFLALVRDYRARRLRLRLLDDCERALREGPTAISSTDIVIAYRRARHSDVKITDRRRR